MDLLNRKPSAAMIVAVIALCFAIVGGAVAAAPVTKSTVKKLAKKQATSVVKADVPGSHVSLADNATNATNATTAANATKAGGLTPTKIFTKIAAGTATTTAYSANGLTLTIACSGGGALTFRASTSVNDSYIGSNTMDLTTPHGNRDSNFDVGDSFDPVSTGPRGAGTITYSQPDGTGVNIVLGTDDSNTFGSFSGCFIHGVAFAT